MTLRDYLGVVRRQKWVILTAVVLVPVAAVAFSLHQQKLYQASAQVLLSSQNLAAQLTGTQSTGINLQPDRIAQTQAEVARVPAVAQRTLTHITGSGLTVQQFLASSSVSTSTNADILGFAVTNHDPLLARRLVDAYALAYTLYRRQLDTASIKHALTGVNVRIRQLGHAGDTKSQLYASLVDRQQTLQTMQALQTSNASVVQQADGVVKTQPKTKRNGILGLVLGLVLGLGLAFLRESLDTRIRSADEVAHGLGGTPLLARLPTPPKRLRDAQQLAMLAEPAGTQAEAFRML
ncbi:MAG: GNVR domain-containing protein, partial [Sciscionella sp.]